MLTDFVRRIITVPAAELLFDWFALDQTSSISVVYRTLAKQLNPKVGQPHCDTAPNEVSERSLATI